MSITVSLPHNDLHVLGRADEREDALAFDWTNSGVFFRFHGKTVRFHFDAPDLNQQLYVQVRVDNRSHRLCVSSEQTVIEVDATEDGDHRVFCVRNNEVLDSVPLVLRRIEIDGEQAALLPRPTLPDRRILFIGDSITCGFGVLTKGLGNGFKTAEQDGSNTAAALTAAHFGAESHFVCISGRGIWRNCERYVAPLIPEFTELTTVSNPVPWDHARFQPHLIVINAGTNDTYGDETDEEKETFKQAITAFIRRLQEVYPNAKILWVYGMMTDHLHDSLQEAIDAFESDRVQYQRMQSVWGFEDERGAANHPNLRAHHRCAGVLISRVSDMTGWDL